MMITTCRAGWRTLAALAVLLLTTPAEALITGGAGNDPVRERAWPQGAVDVANLKSRIAWWEGPPFGGGESHFEYRGDTAAFNSALQTFASMKAPKLRLVVKDGQAQSFWLNPNREPDKIFPVDWTFTVWEAERFYRLFNNPTSTFTADSEHFRQDVPAPEIVLFAGGDVDWSQVTVPAGIEVDDQRLEAHGYKLSDGAVIEARAWDILTLLPVAKAELVVERIDPQPQGGYQYTEVAKMAADADGRMVLKGVPPGWNQISVRADGYSPRIIQYSRDDQPGWSHHNVRLAKALRISGKVVDETGQAVPKAKVRISDVLGPDGKGYGSKRDLNAMSDDQGEFTIEQAPAGYGRFRAYAEQHTFQGLGDVQELSEAPQTVLVVRAGKLLVKVEFGNTKLEGDYIVEVEPEAGAAIGRWSGSSTLGPDGTVTFDHIPPGRYRAYGRPNPGSESQQTESVVMEVKPLEQAEIVLKAK